MCSCTLKRPLQCLHLHQGPANNLLSSKDGAIPRAVLALLKNLSVVPRHRYRLTATYCGLSAAMDATMVDLLAGGVPLASLKVNLQNEALAVVG